MPAEFDGIKEIVITELGLSQIYLDSSKIEAIEKWFCVNNMEIFEPLPVHDFGNGRYTLTDGHTRAYVAFRSGLSRISVMYDRDDIVAGELGTQLYRFDIEWCTRFGLENISFLQNRIVSHEKYRKLWMERCDRSHYLFTENSEAERMVMQNKIPGLYLYGAEKTLSDGNVTWCYENKKGELFLYKNELLMPET